MEYYQHMVDWLSKFVRNADNQQLQRQALINLTPHAEIQAYPAYFNDHLKVEQMQRGLAMRLMMGPCLSPPGWDRNLPYHHVYCAELKQLYTKGYTSAGPASGSVTRAWEGRYDLTDALSTSWVRAETTLEIGDAVARECRLFWVKVETGSEGDHPEDEAEAEAAPESLYPHILRDLVVASYRFWNNLVAFEAKTNLRDLADIFPMPDQPHKDGVRRYIPIESAVTEDHVLNAVLGLPLDCPQQQRRKELHKLNQQLRTDYHELRVVSDLPSDHSNFFVQDGRLDVTRLWGLQKQAPQVFFFIVTPASVVSHEPLDDCAIIEISASEYEALKWLRQTINTLHEA